MDRQAVHPPCARRAEAGVPVGVALLGVRVTAYAVINVGEHRRREAARMGAVVHPGLLDRLMDLPVAVAVADPVAWAEMAGQPPGIVERGEDGASVTRRLESPLAIVDVVVQAAAGRELRAVREASLFAGFTRRWVAAACSRIPDAVMLEAKLCGVGIAGPSCRVLCPAEKPVALIRDGWSWLLEERAYRRWLSGRPGILSGRPGVPGILSGRPGVPGMESRSPATDGARASGTG
jgi:hypothetical protein